MPRPRSQQFLEGLFQNLGHCQDYFKQEKAFTILLDLLDLPCSPALMQKNGGYGSIVALFRIATEVKAYDALAAIIKRTAVWLEHTKWFWDREDGFKESVLSGMVNPSKLHPFSRCFSSLLVWTLTLS